MLQQHHAHRRKAVGRGRGQGHAIGVVGFALLGFGQPLGEEAGGLGGADLVHDAPGQNLCEDMVFLHFSIPAILDGTRCRTHLKWRRIPVGPTRHEAAGWRRTASWADDARPAVGAGRLRRRREAGAAPPRGRRFRGGCPGTAPLLAIFGAAPAAPALGEGDRQQVQAAERRAFAVAAGQPVHWQNPRTGPSARSWRWARRNAGRASYADPSGTRCWSPAAARKRRARPAPGPSGRVGNLPERMPGSRARGPT